MPLSHVTKETSCIFKLEKPAAVPVIEGDGIHHAGFGSYLKRNVRPSELTVIAD